VGIAAIFCGFGTIDLGFTRRLLGARWLSYLDGLRNLGCFPFG